MNKILIVASPWLGGSGSVAFRIAKNLSKEGYEIHFLSYEIPFKESGNSRIKYHKVKGYSYSLFPFPLYELALAENIVRVVLENKIKILHVHYGILFGHAAVLAKEILKSKRYELKIVLTFHGSDVIGFDLEQPGKVVPKQLNEWACNKADCVTVASRALKIMLTQFYNVKRNVEVIPNFIDNKLYYPQPRNFTNKRIIHISNFRKVKQPMALIKIFYQISKKMKSVKLILIGEGPELSKVKQYIKRMKITNVSILGKISDERKLTKYLQSSHLLLLPSLFENFPLVALEAQACGVPVVASNQGGLPETVIHGETGLLCDANDLNSFVRNSLSIFKDQKTWIEFSNNAREFAKQFEEENVMKKYLNIYNSLLKESQGSYKWHKNILDPRQVFRVLNTFR